MDDSIAPMISPDSIRVGILTVSDGVMEGREDASGDRIEAAARAAGWSIAVRDTVPDETVRIVDKLISWSDGSICDLLLTTGGTGLTREM